jgi:hypothetical protein
MIERWQTMKAPLAGRTRLRRAVYIAAALVMLAAAARFVHYCLTHVVLTDARIAAE